MCFSDVPKLQGFPYDLAPEESPKVCLKGPVPSEASQPDD